MRPPLQTEDPSQRDLAGTVLNDLLAEQGRALEGYIESFAEHEARGWAWQPDAPGQHLEIIARVGSEEIGRATADQFRADLARKGIGRGDHQFRVVFTRWLSPAVLPGLRFTVRTDAGEQELPIIPGSNFSLADKASDPTYPIVDETSEPVFILGPARSGTSALALALLGTGHYEGHGEGHLLPLVQELLQTADRYYAASERAARLNTRLQATHLAAFQRMVRRGIIQLTRATYPSGRWLDKTPTAQMIRAAPLMQELWPKARFIFCKRRVLEVIASRRRKFPDDTLQNHYLDWVDSMQTWLSVRDQLGNRAIEIEQLEMARNPHLITARIAEFLGLSDPAKFGQALVAERPEQTGESPAALATLESLNLSDDDVRELRVSCASAMNAYGYTYDIAPVH